MLYSEKVMEHFTHPRNVGTIDNADGIGEVGNAKCGDIMKIYLKIDNDIISEVKFNTFGCGSAIASSSMATEMIKGKPLSKALELTNKAVVEALDGLPPHKIHCSVLAEEAVKAAIKDYYDKNGIEYDKTQFPEEHCIKEQEIMKERDIDERIIHATASHGYALTVDIKPEHEMEKVLYAVDELTGLIGAVALMRPSKSVSDLELKSVKKKYKNFNFAAGCSKRHEIKQLIRPLKRDNPQIEKSIFNSIHLVCLDTMVGYKSIGIEHTFLERFNSNTANANKQVL